MAHKFFKLGEKRRTIIIQCEFFLAYLRQLNVLILTVGEKSVSSVNKTFKSRCECSFFFKHANPVSKILAVCQVSGFKFMHKLHFTWIPFKKNPQNTPQTSIRNYSSLCNYVCIWYPVFICNLFYNLNNVNRYFWPPTSFTIFQWARFLEFFFLS